MPNPVEQKIPLSDLKSGRVKIIGRLGVPIGDVAVVSGTWRLAKESGPTKVAQKPHFVVEFVNGKMLSTPETFSPFDVAILPNAKGEVKKDGLNQSLVVFESVCFEGIPDSAWQDGRSPIQALRPTGFYSTLEIIRVETQE